MFKTEGISSAEYLDPMLLATELKRTDTDEKELYGLRKSSLMWKVLSSIKDNNTFSSRNLGNAENGYDWSKFRSADHKNREEKIHEGRNSETSKSTVRIERNDDLRRKHSRRPRPRYAQTTR